MLRELERARVEDGLSQRQLARRLGVSQSYLSRLIARKAPLSSAASRKIRNFLERRRGLHRDRALWATKIAEAAEGSAYFREAIEAIMRLMHNDT